MPLVVQKFGGTSVGDADRIRAVADHIARTRRQGSDVVAVVSAMGKTTDDLIHLANSVSTTQPPREYDMLVSTGERVSMSLLVMALADLGVDAASFTGSQVGIITDSDHTRAKIKEVKGDRLREALAAGRVPVVAGFQGVSAEREITTLGRGGSDATAVALAAVLGADACEIYTDVTGVFTADPRIVPEAHRINRISFDEMLEMAATGGRVLMLRAVEFARNHNVPLHVRSSFTWEPGTWVVEEDADMEEAVVTAVTHDTSEAKVTVSGVPDRPGVAARLFRALADKSINVDMIVQNTSAHGTTDISFTVPTADLAVAVETSQAHADELGASGVTADAAVARVSLVGVGMKSHPGIAATMFETLADEKINIDMISTSTIRTSCIVAESRRRAGRAQPAPGVRPGLMPPHAKGSRTLWLLRHAKAVTDPPPGGSDFDRVLAPRGRRDATALGRLFAGHGEGLGPALQVRPARPAGAGVAGGPHGADGRAGAGGPGGAARGPPTPTSSSAPTPRRCSPWCAACPTTSPPPWSSGTTPPPTPSRSPCWRPATRRAVRWRCGTASPPVHSVCTPSRPTGGRAWRAGRPRWSPSWFPPTERVEPRRPEHSGRLTLRPTRRGSGNPRPAP